MPVVPTGDIRRAAVRAGGARGLDLTRSDGQVGTDFAISRADPWLCRPGYLGLIDGAGAGDSEGQGGLTDSERDMYRIDFDAAARTIAGEQDVDFGQTHAVRHAATLAAIRESHELATVVRAG